MTLLVAACGDGSTGTSSDPSVDGPADVSQSPESSGVVPAGFTTIRGEVTDAAGEVCEVCLWLADTPDERGRGLMGVTDLGGADGMVFVWSDPTTGSFYMFRTPTPLSIAWFADGSFVASTDMEPCRSESSAWCERYRPGVPYTAAVEVFRGDLGDLGIGPGSTIRLLPDTESTTCTP